LSKPPNQAVGTGVTVSSYPTRSAAVSRPCDNINVKTRSISALDYGGKIMRRTLMALSGVIILMMSATSFASICGDVNNSGAVGIQDVTYLINYLYKGGPEPFCCGDVNNSTTVNIQDITYLINYLYKRGPAPCPEVVTDIDGNIYQAIRLGDQWWMAENLKVAHYRNGDAIPNVIDSGTWYDLTTGAYCNYKNSANNADIYGRLYNWYAVRDNRRIAPAGWHVATDGEWQKLIDYLGGDAVAGGKMKEAGTTHWWNPNTGATNESDFSALPGGYRLEYADDHELGNEAWFRGLGYFDSEVFRNSGFKVYGFSVRCVRDDSNVVIDIDGNIYQTVTIGTQVWIAENLKVTHYRNGEAIPNVTDNDTWEGLDSGAYCEYDIDIYDNDIYDNAVTYGRLYNWHAVNDSRNIAPVGWHVPSDAELQTLVDYLGGDAVAGGKMKETGTTHWSGHNTGATNESGFTALPGGDRNAEGTYLAIWDNAFFWSSQANSTWALYHNTAGVVHGDNHVRFGFSVRCVKD
jgi:uncharacterized protein (TIGR02145 family)